MFKEHSGLKRTYLPTYDLSKKIPTVEEISKSDHSVDIFVDHVTLNHKGLNWKIFRYNLNKDNYKSFMYAFAIIVTSSKPWECSMWQFEGNARRLEKALKRNNIPLTRFEKYFLKKCKNLSKYNGYLFRSKDVWEMIQG